MKKKEYRLLSEIIGFFDSLSTYFSGENLSLAILLSLVNQTLGRVLVSTVGPLNQKLTITSTSKFINAVRKELKTIFLRQKTMMVDSFRELFGPKNTSGSCAVSCEKNCSLGHIGFEVYAYKKSYPKLSRNQRRKKIKIKKQKTKHSFAKLEQ